MRQGRLPTLALIFLPKPSSATLSGILWPLTMLLPRGSLCLLGLGATAAAQRMRKSRGRLDATGRLRAAEVGGEGLPPPLTHTHAHARSPGIDVLLPILLPLEEVRALHLLHVFLNRLIGGLHGGAPEGPLGQAV